MSKDNFDNIMDEMELIDMHGDYYTIAKVHFGRIGRGTDLAVNLPAKLMGNLGWEEGDELVWKLTDIPTERMDMDHNYVGATICRKEDFDNEQTI